MCLCHIGQFFRAAVSLFRFHDLHEEMDFVSLYGRFFGGPARRHNESNSLSVDFRSRLSFKPQTAAASSPL
jgi:hypothetical protein